MTHYESPLAVTAKGAIAGLAGTGVLTLAMRLGPVLMQRLGAGSAGQDGGEEPTAKLAGKVAGGVFETEIGERKKQVAGQAIHWGYGAAWGAFYGIAQSSLRLPHLMHGTVFGALIGVVGSTLVPAMRLVPPPTEQPKTVSAMQTVFHLLYGWTVALVFHGIARNPR